MSIFGEHLDDPDCEPMTDEDTCDDHDDYDDYDETGSTCSKVSNKSKCRRKKKECGRVQLMVGNISTFYNKNCRTIYGVIYLLNPLNVFFAIIRFNLFMVMNIFRLMNPLTYIRFWFNVCKTLLGFFVTKKNDQYNKKKGKNCTKSKSHDDKSCDNGFEESSECGTSSTIHCLSDLEDLFDEEQCEDFNPDYLGL